MPSTKESPKSVATSPEKDAPTRKRLNLDLTPEAYDLLQKLAADTGKNMADVLRVGLALYGIAQDEKGKGNTIAIADKEDRVIKQILTT